MATSGIEKDKEILVTIRKVGGVYVSDPIDRLKEKQGNNLTWHFQNNTSDNIDVKLQNFIGVTSPLDDPGPPPEPIDATKKGTITIKAKDRLSDRYNYNIVVTNRGNPAESNILDPELQIDGKRGANALLVLGAAAAGAAVGAATVLLTQ
jgi:hypothetical protein